MEDDPKVIQLEKFNKINITEHNTITHEELYKNEIAQLQKDLYNAYDRIRELNDELLRMRSRLKNKE